MVSVARTAAAVVALAPSRRRGAAAAVLEVDRLVAAVPRGHVVVAAGDGVATPQQPPSFPLRRFPVLIPVVGLVPRALLLLLRRVLCLWFRLLAVGASPVVMVVVMVVVVVPPLASRLPLLPSSQFDRLVLLSLPLFLEPNGFVGHPAVEVVVLLALPALLVVALFHSFPERISPLPGSLGAGGGAHFPLGFQDGIVPSKDASLGHAHVGIIVVRFVGVAFFLLASLEVGAAVGYRAMVVCRRRYLGRCWRRLCSQRCC